jgi:CoA:oxalate CoA-transferase
LGNKLWGEYCRVIGKPELENDKSFHSNELRVKNRAELRKVTRPIMKTKTVEEWINQLKNAGIPCGVVNNVKDACNMEQIQSRNMLCQAGKYKMAGNPMKISGYEDPNEKGNVPGLGEDTQKILNEFK